jgi:hypothetical protein
MFTLHNLSQSTLVFEEGIFVAAKATVSSEASNKWPFYGAISPEYTNVFKSVLNKLPLLHQKNINLSLIFYKLEFLN